MFFVTFRPRFGTRLAPAVTKMAARSAQKHPSENTSKKYAKQTQKQTLRVLQAGASLLGLQPGTAVASAIIGKKTHLFRRHFVLKTHRSTKTGSGQT